MRRILAGLFAALIALALAAPARAQDGGSATSLMDCPPMTDGALAYQATYLKADWARCDTPGHPDLVVALQAKIVNRSGGPLVIANPVVAFHDNVRVRFPDGSLASSAIKLFPPTADAPETITLEPFKPYAFAQGTVVKWQELHKKQKVEEKIYVVAEINLPEEKAGASAWHGCIESRIGDIVYPKEETNERHHPDQTPRQIGDALRKEHGLPDK